MPTLQKRLAHQREYTETQHRLVRPFRWERQRRLANDWVLDTTATLSGGRRWTQHFNLLGGHPTGVVSPITNFETTMYNEIIERFIAAQKAARAAYLSVAAFEREVLGDVPEHYRTVELRTEYKTRDELRKMCRTLAGNVVNRAQRDFAPCGSRLDIKDQDEHEIAGLDIEDALNKGRVPDIDRLWTSLQARYQGDGGREMAYRQAAGRIVRTFGLSRKSEVKRTASAIILRKTVHSESVFNSSSRRVGHYSTQYTGDCLSGLATFAGKAGFVQIQANLSSVNLYDLRYDYREKWSMPGLDLVFFKDAWEFKFSHEVGNELMLFVGEYGQEALSERD
jgi:hypothetical protein